MPILSSGVMLFRRKGRNVEVFLVHPGGPFWKTKDLGVWTIPKGLVEENEDSFDAAVREFKEETGIKLENQVKDFIDLDKIKYKSGKEVICFAIEKDLGEEFKISSNQFPLEWPKNSGNIIYYPEVDRGEYFETKTALKKILKAQAEFIYKINEVVLGISVRESNSDNQLPLL